MKSLAKAVMLILLLFNAGVLISSADPPLPLPNTFSGTVKFANSSGQFDVPAGTVIEALIENVTKGSTTVIEAGKYMIDVNGTYDDDGRNITFMVNNITAEQRAIFNVSYPPPVTLNLIVNLHVQTTPVSNNVCAALCHNYEKRIDRGVDFYPNTMTSFDRYETFLGILNEMRDTPMNVTDPTIDFYFNTSQLYGNRYDYFRKVQPLILENGRAFFEFNDMTLSNGNGTYGIDLGERNDTAGFSVLREVENNGFVTEDGYYNVTVSAVLYEDVNGFIALSVNLGNSSEYNAWLVGWNSTVYSGDNNTYSNGVNVNFNTWNETLPKNYNMTTNFYVDKIIPANITLKPWVSVVTRRNLQTIENVHGSNISVNGTKFNMNSTFASSSTNLTWIAQEGYEKHIEFDGGIVDILNPYAVFSFNKDFVVETDNDSLSSGNYDSSLRYNFDIYNENDTSDTVLGNIRFGAGADNITRVYGWEQYAAWNRTSVNWTFPPSYVLPENEGTGLGFSTNYSESKYLNVNISRWMNQTEFSSEGYQLAKFNVTFKDKNFEWVWARIEANERHEVNPSIVKGTFTTDAPGRFNEWEHGIHFDFDKDSIVPGVTYDFSVVVRVNLTGNEAPPVRFKPQFSVGKGMYYNYTVAQGYDVQMPEEMLPDNIRYASASTNVSSAWLIKRHDHIIARLEADRTPPVIKDFKVEPNISVSTAHPAIASAFVSDANLMDVAFGIIDSSNLVDTNMTVLGLYVNESGMNGFYVTPGWHANAYGITNGTSWDPVTVTAFPDAPDYLTVGGRFKKNATALEEEAALWFNITTGSLSNITAGRNATPLTIEHGNSTFKVLKFKFVDGLDNPPRNVEGATFVLYSIGSPNNPYVASRPVLSGSYKAVVHAEDTEGNDNGVLVDVGVTQSLTPKPVVPRKPIAGKLEVILIPENPTIYDNLSMEVKLTYPTAGYKVKFGNVSIENNTITVNVYSEEPEGMAAQVITTYSKKYNLGYLSEGAYACEVYINGVLAETYRFVVSATVAAPPSAPGGGGGY